VNRATQISIVAGALIFVVSCGGGGGGGGGLSASNASPGGIWRGTDSISGLQVVGLVTEDGEFHFIRSDKVQYVGTASTFGNSISANGEGFVPFGSAFPDGSVHGTGTASGTIQARTSTNLNTQFKTDAGTVSSGTLSLTFDALYNRPSSLGTISGTFTDTSTGVAVTVDSTGAVFAQNPSTGCILNGTVSVLNASYDAYRVQYSFANCQGQAAVLNGVQFSGLATLDNTTTPERAIVGVTGQSGGTKYAIVDVLDRS
jgi:hypothetical protein